MLLGENPSHGALNVDQHVVQNSRENKIQGKDQQLRVVSVDALSEPVTNLIRP